MAHEGQKALTLEYYDVTRYNIDFSMMARDFAGLLKENVRMHIQSVFMSTLTNYFADKRLHPLRCHLTKVLDDHEE